MLRICALFAVLLASSARADNIWEVEGAFPAFPAATATSTVEGEATDAPVAIEEVAAAPASDECPYQVQLLSQDAVGEPCLTTAAFMDQLGLSAAAKARVERLSRTAH